MPSNIVCILGSILAVTDVYSTLARSAGISEPGSFLHRQMDHLKFWGLGGWII